MARKVTDSKKFDLPFNFVFASIENVDLPSWNLTLKKKNENSIRMVGSVRRNDVHGYRSETEFNINMEISQEDEGTRVFMESKTDSFFGEALEDYHKENFWNFFYELEKEIMAKLDKGLAKGEINEEKYNKTTERLEKMLEEDKDRIDSIKKQREESEESSGCFIATASLGTPLHPKLNILRKFRDEKLKELSLGRGLIEIYYKLSPPLARIISKSPRQRKLCRKLLVEPIVRKIKD